MRGDDLDDTAKHEVVVSFIAEAANKKTDPPAVICGQVSLSHDSVSLRLPYRYPGSK